MNIFKHKTLNVIADQPAHEMMETDPDADISLDPTVHCTLLAKSPIQTALSVRESLTDSLHCRICESNAAEGSLRLCKWKSWRHGSGLCR